MAVAADATGRRTGIGKSDVMTEDILYAVEAGVATITLNRPDKLNALTPAMLGDVFRKVREASADDDVRVILLTGAGRAFCAGLDLKVIGTGGAPRTGHSIGDTGNNSGLSGSRYRDSRAPGAVI